MKTTRILMLVLKLYLVGTETTREEHIDIKTAAHYAVDGIGWNFVQIELTSLDLYKMTFFRYRGTRLLDQYSIDMCQAEDLRPIFENHTGLRTSL